MKFEWDPAKAKKNPQKHGISFEEAITVFADWQSLTIPDTEHSEEEANARERSKYAHQA